MLPTYLHLNVISCIHDTLVKSSSSSERTKTHICESYACLYVKVYWVRDCSFSLHGAL